MNIEQFNGFDIQLEYDKIVDEYANKCKDQVQNNVRKRNLIKTGRYLNGWTTTVEKTYSNGYGVVVHNETDWQLTHLLENGHLIVNKKGGTGWAAAYPHIDPAFRAVKNKFVKAMENVKLKVDEKG